MKKTAVKLVAVVVTALLALTGCADTNPKVAATVGSDQILLAQVDAISKAVAAKSPDNPEWGGWRTSVVQVLIQSKLAKQAQQMAGITITDAQRKQAFASSEFYVALDQDPVTHDFISDFVDTNVVLNNPAGRAALGQVIPAVPVVVNPVFGEWDPTKAQLTGSTGSLSKSLS